MSVNVSYFRVLFLCICGTFIFTWIIIGHLPLAVVNSAYISNEVGHDKLENNRQRGSSHKLAVLVPFRERFEELLDFVPHLSKFLKKQNIDHRIFILNQVDRYRFNRASLINVGYLYTKDNFDYIAMHDVDLLPLNDNLSYKYPTKGPFHVSGPAYHPKYHYPAFVGGILLLNRIHFKQVGGMSNQYWGWGLEDDEFYVRIKEAGLVVSRPENLTTGTENTFKHIHDRNHRKRDTVKCFNQREVTRKRDRKTGLHNVEYTLENKYDITIDNFAATVLNIKLICDKQSTPWCECIDNNNNNKKQQKL